MKTQLSEAERRFAEQGKSISELEPEEPAKPEPGPDDFVYRNPAPNASAPHVPSRSKVFEISAALAQSGEPPMTDEELQRLIKWMRENAPDWTTSGRRIHMAAKELERLAALLHEARERLRYFDEQQIQFPPEPGNFNDGDRWSTANAEYIFQSGKWIESKSKTGGRRRENPNENAR